MKKNIGVINAIVRITFGFAILSWVTAKMVRRPWRDSYFWVALMAGMKIAEGITRYCPLTALFEQYKGNDHECNQNSHGNHCKNSHKNNNENQHGTDPSGNNNGNLLRNNNSGNSNGNLLRNNNSENSNGNQHGNNNSDNSNGSGNNATQNIIDQIADNFI